MKKLLGILAVAVLASGLAGCATSRSTVMPAVSKAANPTQGVAVKMGTVEDVRKFETNPPDPSQPSLGSISDVQNPAITSRAIGRKRGGYGQAFGDVLLPEGKPVTSMVQDVVADAFKRSGYRVLEPADDGYTDAPAIDVRVDAFWSWFTPGFFTVSVENKAEVFLKAPLPGLENGITVRGYAIKRGTAIFESDWQDIAGMGLADFEKNLQAQLEKLK